MDLTAQWNHDVSAMMTANAGIAGKSTRSRPHNIDANSRFPVSPRHTRLSQSQFQTPIRDTTPDGSESDTGATDEEVDLEASSEPGPDDLDDPWPYTFRMGESVWIRTEGGNWYPGKVSSNNAKRGPTRQKEGLFYPVIFGIGARIRKHFAPLNGEIKPDTGRTRTLLRQAGWL